MERACCSSESRCNIVNTYHSFTLFLPRPLPLPLALIFLSLLSRSPSPSAGRNNAHDVDLNRDFPDQFLAAVPHAEPETVVGTTGGVGHRVWFIFMFCMFLFLSFLSFSYALSFFFSRTPACCLCLISGCDELDHLDAVCAFGQPARRLRGRLVPLRRLAQPVRGSGRERKERKREGEREREREIEERE